MPAETIFDAEVAHRDNGDIATKKAAGQGAPPFLDEPPFDPGDDGDPRAAKPFIGSAYIAMLLFIGADVMFFAGLIGAFIVFRFGAMQWPPLGQPRLPVEVTGVNTAILLLSGYTMLRAWRATRRWNLKAIIDSLTLTLVLGSIFLLVQGYEWTKLLKFGLTLSSSVYGGTFYVLIGCHALHVLGAAIWLFAVLRKVRRGHFLEKPEIRVKLAGMYWFLVVALWPVLYTLVYL
jgi:heme/copper-type cytochrome/quinol oxidase subunit 3